MTGFRQQRITDGDARVGVAGSHQGKGGDFLQASSAEQLREIQVEMIDRFGLLPEPIKNLFTAAMIRVRAQSLGISEIDITDEGGSIEFTATTVVEPADIVTLIQSDPLCYSLSGSGKLRVKKSLPTLDARAEFVENLISPWLEAA